MSNTEYPKMLYSGDKENYSCRAVQDADEEEKFREIGLVDYADLDEPQPVNIGHADEGDEAPQGFIATEQFDALAERLANAEAEIERLKQESALESTSQASDIQPQSTDYNELTIPQLQTLLDEKDIKYLARDSKETLINLLG